MHPRIMHCLTLLLLIFLSFHCIADVESENGNGSENTEELIWENIVLIKKGSFEGIDINIVRELWRVTPQDLNIEIDTENFLSGKSSLKVEGRGNVELKSYKIPIPSGAVSITGSVGFRGENVDKSILIQWFKGDTQLREDLFEKRSITQEGWERFTLSEKIPPKDATFLEFWVQAQLPDDGKFWIDEVNLTLSIEDVKRVEILINQVGYDLVSPKKFVVATNFKPGEVEGAILAPDNNKVATVTFAEPKRVVGWNESDWGRWFLRGDFTPFDQEGVYRICLWVDNKKYISDEFVIGKDLIWEKTVPAVLNGIRIHRCGIEVEGIHKECHLDDTCSGKSVVGGWHNGNDYGKDKSSLVLSLLSEAYQICKWRIVKDEQLDKAFQEELKWGARYILGRIKDDKELAGNIVAKSSFPHCLPEIETDNTVGNEDDRVCSGESSDEELCASALAYMGYSLSPSPDADTYISLAESLSISLAEKKKKNNLLFNSLVMLAEKKGYEKYLPYLKETYPDNLINSVDTILFYDSHIGEGLSLYNLGQVVKKAMDTYTALSEDNPFGLCPRNFLGSKSLLISGEGKEPSGVNEYILQIAQIAGRAFKSYPNESVKNMFFDQINWILGVNPYGVCMIEGLGKKTVPTYVHAYVRAGVNPKNMTGCIPYGIRALTKDIDIPYIDTTGTPSPDAGSLGVSVDIMAMYINALAQFYRVRVHGGGGNAPLRSN